MNENGTTKKWFWKDGLSIDETKLSALIICLFGCLIFGGLNYSTIGDISANLTTIITALIYSIAGVNITNSIVNRFSTSKVQQVEPPQYVQTSSKPSAEYVQEMKVTTARQSLPEKK